MARTSNFANVATVTRASTKTDAGGWDFTSGGTVGTLTEYASGVAAIHPTAGLLVEESTTNEIRNPRCEGAVAGSPGTAPTHWSISDFDVTDSGYEDGWPYVEVEGDSAGSLSLVRLEDTGYVSAANGQTWSYSVGVKVVSGAADLTEFQIRGRFTQSGSFGEEARLDVGSDFPSSHTRYAATETTTVATESITPYFYIRSSGTVRIRIYAPQLEEKAYPTSPVFPVASSPAASTRAEDLILIPYGAWGQTTAQTLYVEATRSANGGGYILDLQAGSTERIALRFLSGNIRGDVTATANGGDNYGQTLVAVAAGADIKAALALAHNDLAFSATGATQNTSSTVDVPTTPNNLTVGAALDSAAAHANCYIKDIRYWPKRLTNAELEALVGN